MKGGFDAERESERERERERRLAAQRGISKKELTRQLHTIKHTKQKKKRK
jgi:hypothetical protein